MSPSRRTGRALVLAVTMFSVVPLPSSAGLDRRLASRALLWLPLVGAVVGAIAMLPALAVWRGGSHGATLLAATLTIAALALLTRGLHLDGLADLADGLGSNRPREQALAIMAKSDIGPLGVAAVGLSLLLQVSALGAILQASDRPAALVALVSATTVGRLTAIWAAGTRIPAARPGGFGALVAGSSSWLARIASTLVVLVAVLGCAWWAGEDGTSLIWLIASCLAALAIAGLTCAHAVRRLGGMTGDVFGALIEIATTVMLVVFAGSLAWR